MNHFDVGTEATSPELSIMYKYAEKVIWVHLRFYNTFNVFSLFIYETVSDFKKIDHIGICHCKSSNFSHKTGFIFISDFYFT